MNITRMPRFDPRAALHEEVEEDVVSVRVRKADRIGHRLAKDPGVAQNNLDRFAKDIKGLGLSRFGRTYSKLDEGNIRVVVIRPGTFEDPLELDLLQLSLENPPPYEALSYEWGDSPPINSVILRDWTTPLTERIQTPLKRLQFLVFREVGTRILIRKNLYDALLRFRDPKVIKKLWIDAICINQKNNKEKAHQIRQMAEVYNKAQNVRIWLGEASELSDMGMDFVKELVRLEDLKLILTRDESLQKWIALIELMRSRWFSRRWVIQEQAVSRKSSVYCGGKIVHWNDFADAVEVFKKELPRISNRFGQQTEFAKPDALGMAEAFGAVTLAASTSTVMTKDGNGAILEKKFSLEELISRLVAFESIDPRDTIYAMLSISRLGHVQQGDLPTPDYHKSLLQVYTDFVHHCVQVSGRLDIILRNWAPVATAIVVEVASSEMRRVETKLPSWIKQLNESSFGTPGEIFRGRKNGDSLVGVNPLYNACGKNLAGKPRFGKRSKPNNVNQEDRGRDVLLNEDSDGTVQVGGLVMGEIHRISPRMIPKILPKEVTEMGGWNFSGCNEDQDVERVPPPLWRTLVANKDPDRREPPVFFRRACLYALQREDTSGDVNLEKLIDNEDTPSGVRSYLTRVRDVTWNRKAFVGGKRDELFGLCPQSAKQGDMICIIYGCSVPVILRKGDEKPELGQSLVPKLSSSALGRSSSRSTQKSFPQHHPIATVDPTSRVVVNISVNSTTNPWADATSAQTAATPPVFYEVIGECYVDGRMDGEAIDNADYAGCEQSFILV